MSALAGEQTLDRLTVLSAGGEHGKAPSFTGRGSESVKVGDQLRLVKPAGGRETIRAALAIKQGETRFNVRHGKDFVERFGSGKKTLGAMTPEEKASFKHAQDVIQRNATLALFLELRTLPQAEQLKLLGQSDIKAALGLPAGATLSIGDVRKAALDAVAKNPSFIAMFPEVGLSIKSQKAQMDFIEKTLMPAEEGRMASRLGTRMQEAYKKAVGLEIVLTDEQRAALEQTKKADELTCLQRAKSLGNLLASKGINNPVTGAAYTDKEIVTLMRTSVYSPESAADVIGQQTVDIAIGGGLLPQEYRDIKEYRVDNAKKIHDIEARHGNAPPPLGDPDNASYTALVARNVALSIQFPAGNAILTAFDTQVLPLFQDGTFPQLAAEVKGLDQKVQDAETKLAVMPKTTADIEKSRDERILAEEDLCAELDGIIGEAIADVLEERYDVMEERMGRLMEDKAKKQEQETAKLTLLLKKKMSENWIKRDPVKHKKVVNKKAIKRDVTHLGFSADKDVALKQLIARDIFVSTGSALKMSNFHKLNLVDGTDNATGAALLDQTQLAQVEQIFKEVGHEYRSKLFTDLFAARTIKDRTLSFMGAELVPSWATLGFKRDEWSYMLQQYEPEITAGIEKNQEAKALLTSLEAQGVKVDFKLKWLIAMLFGGAAVGAVGLPIALGATGLGIAAAGIGGGLGGGSLGAVVGTGIGLKKAA